MIAYDCVLAIYSYHGLGATRRCDKNPHEISHQLEGLLVLNSLWAKVYVVGMRSRSIRISGVRSRLSVLRFTILLLRAGPRRERVFSQLTDAHSMHPSIILS
jgi:hypothetical protein